MIELILPFIKDADKRALPAYQTFLKAQSVFIKERYDRLYRAQGRSTNATKLLTYILEMSDFPYLDKQINNYDRYLYHVKSIRENIVDVFDRSARGRGYYELFFGNVPSTEEFIFPIEDINTIVRLPLDSSSWNEWRKVRCIRLWDHNSNILSVNFVGDSLKFSKDAPSNSLILLDTAALIFKYYIWYKTQRQNETDPLANTNPMQLFVHKYVMMDLVWDSAQIWLLNNLIRLFDLPRRDFDEMFLAESMRADQQWGWVAVNSRTGFRALYDLVRDTEKNIHPNSIISSKILFGGSLYDRIILASKHLNLPERRQYDYLRWMRDRKLLNLVVDLFNCRPELPITKNMKIVLSREFNRVLMARPWNISNSLSLKQEIETDMVGFYNKLTSI
jgi:hypothetical protein